MRSRRKLTPHFVNERVFTLDEAARHRWRPVAPSARVEVELQKPELRWSGHAYFDRNWGDEPIEDGFVYWDWSRAAMGKEESAILYNMDRRHAGAKSLALRFSPQGVEEFESPPNHRLPRTPIWQVPRGSQADAGCPPKVAKTLEDTPFYSRLAQVFHLLGQLLGVQLVSLALDRFRSPIVQHMLPYRMPRRRR